MRFPSILGFSIRRQNTIYIAICVILSVILIGIAVASSFTMIDRDPSYISEDLAKSGALNVDVELISLDVVTGSLVVDIYPWFYDNTAEACPKRKFNIFQDGNLLVPGPDSEDIPNTDQPEKPSFQLNYDPCNNTIWRHNAPTWRQTLKLFLLPLNLDANGGRRGYQYGSVGGGLQAYPFDSYYSTFFLYAEEELPTRNASFSINVSAVSGVVANFETDKAPGNFPVGQAPPDGVYDAVVRFSVKRSYAVKVFCFVIVVTNWIVTLVFLWITIACLLWKEKVVKELFAIPISVLFAFTAVRGSMPGAPPGFGAFIDYVSILPNFAMLTCCSFILIILILVERIKERSREAKDGSEANSDETPEKEQIAFPTPMV